MSGSYTPCTLIHWNAGYESDGGLGLESVVRATLMRVEEEWWCSVVFNILQQFLLSSCGTTTSKMKWKSKNSKKGAERHTAWRYLISIRSTSPSIHWKSGRPNIITSLILSQNNALFGKKKNCHRDWARPLPQFSWQTGVSRTLGRIGVYPFLRECCFRVRVI